MKSERALASVGVSGAAGERKQGRDGVKHTRGRAQIASLSAAAHFNMYVGTEEGSAVQIKVSVTTVLPPCAEFGEFFSRSGCALSPSSPMSLAIPLQRHKDDLSSSSLLVPAYRSASYLLPPHIPLRCCPPLTLSPSSPLSSPWSHRPLPPAPAYVASAGGLPTVTVGLKCGNDGRICLS